MNPLLYQLSYVAGRAERGIVADRGFVARWVKSRAQVLIGLANVWVFTRVTRLPNRVRQPRRRLVTTRPARASRDRLVGSGTSMAVISKLAVGVSNSR